MTELRSAKQTLKNLEVAIRTGDILGIRKTLELPETNKEIIDQAILLAISANNKEAVRIFLGAGADPHKLGPMRMTPREYARKTRKFDALEALDEFEEAHPHQEAVNQ